MIDNKYNNLFIGLDNRTNVLSCNLTQNRPKSALEIFQANKAANLIFESINQLKDKNSYYIWADPNLCESVLFQAKNKNIKTAIAIEHINRGGLAIPSSKDAIEIIKIFHYSQIFQKAERPMDRLKHEDLICPVVQIIQKNLNQIYLDLLI